MNTHRKTAIIVGVLFIIATAFLFIGEAFVESYKVVPVKVSLSRTGLSRILNRRRREIPEHHRKMLARGTMVSHLPEFIRLEWGISSI